MGKAPKATKAPHVTKAPQGVQAPKVVKAPQGTSTPVTKAPVKQPAVKQPSPVEVRATPNGGCLDATASIAKDENGRELNCTDLKAHCNHAENGPTLQRLCPASCGVCAANYLR